MRDVYDTYLSWVATHKAQDTYVTYRGLLTHYRQAFPDPSLVTVEDVEHWLARPAGRRPRATSTKLKEAIILKAFYRFLHERYGIENVMAGVKLPRKPRRLPPKQLPRRVINEVIAGITYPPYRTLVLLMADAGLRAGEACSLTPDQVVFGPRAHLRALGKGNAERVVPIGRRLEGALREELGRYRGRPDEPLVRTANGKPYSRRDMWDIVAKAGVQAGIPDLHPHRLRHSWACWLHYDKGVPLATVSRLLGHTSLHTTQIYLGVRDEELFKISALLEEDV